MISKRLYTTNLSCHRFRLLASIPGFDYRYPSLVRFFLRNLLDVASGHQLTHNTRTNLFSVVSPSTFCVWRHDASCCTRLSLSEAFEDSIFILQAPRRIFKLPSSSHRCLLSASLLTYTDPCFVALHSHVFFIYSFQIFLFALHSTILLYIRSYLTFNIPLSSPHTILAHTLDIFYPFPFLVYTLFNTSLRFARLDTHFFPTCVRPVQ
ncbi:hypothetical protein BKA70DRAFT_756783 [Coprinopsis sp. MPI-PUGE-AT-0042]|nr:hypothetical protein BKA70DRAFT_756783 [Coprinopsis sp. MPI-PUGE-AT-0042]